MSGRKIIYKYLGLVSLCLFLLFTLVSLSQNLSLPQTFFGQSAFKPADISIDVASPLGPMTQPWRSIAQGGEAANYELAPIMGELTTLKPEYIRLDHLYDFYTDVRKDSQGKLVINWERLDKLIQTITSVGAVPYLSLSYMPSAISRSDLVDRPVNWADWRALVRQTVEHVSGRSWLNLSGVYYEVWNEPDLFGQWKLYGDKNYLELYQASVTGANQAVDTNPYFIGGPATTALFPNWVNNFYEAAMKQNLRVDFYSWHRYHTDPQVFVDDVVKYYNLVRRYPSYTGLQPIISEMGHSSERHTGYDTNYAAAHTVMVLSKLIPTLKHAFLFEIQDGLDPKGQEFWGSWGLLSHQSFGSHPKPRYHAAKLLNRLGQNRLNLSGQGTYVGGLAASNDTGEVEVILTNFDPASSHTETVPVNFKNVSSGNYRLTTEFLGRLPTSTLITVAGDTYLHRVAMPPNSVLLLTLIKQ